MHAEEAYVLSPADVSNIRKYVQHKYGALPQEENRNDCRCGESHYT